MKTWLIALTLLSVVIGYSSASLALPLSNQTLFDRGNGMIYDAAQNLTWLRDANYAKTTGYGARAMFEQISGWSEIFISTGNTDLRDSEGYIQGYADFLKYEKQTHYYDPFLGSMNWVYATEWAETLVYGGYDDWRLPTTPSTDLSCQIAHPGCGGELGYLTTVELGNTGGNQSINYGPFKNVQSMYWTGSHHIVGPEDFYFTVFFNGGGEDHMIDYPVTSTFVWAVRDGDVRHSHSVPEPSTLIFLGSGLAGIIALRKSLLQLNL